MELPQLAVGINLLSSQWLPPRLLAVLGSVETTCSSQDTSSFFLSLYESFSYPQSSRAEPPQKSK